MNWYPEAFRIFKKSPGMWILLNFVSLAILLGSARTLLGGLFGGFIFIFLKMGLARAAEEVEQGKSLEFEFLLSAFRRENLGLLGIEFVQSFVGIIGSIGIGVLTFLVLAGFDPLKELVGIALSNSPDQKQKLLEMAIQLLPAVWISLFFAMIGAALTYMATLFAPFLIVFKKMSVFDSLRKSFNACIKNVWPLTVYGLLTVFWTMIAVVPLFLGLLVFIPIMHISLYCAYRELFGKFNS